MRNQVLKDINLRIIFGITLMAVLGVSSITPALPVVQERFQISEQQVAMLITIFTLPGVFLTPVLGVLADLWGRKRIVLYSLFLFTISGTACAFVTDFTVLLILRFLQGMGTAALGSMNVTLIGDIFSGKQRAEAMGYNSSVLSVGTGLYPALGGLLAAIGWNYPFLLAALGLPVGLLTLKKLHNPEPENHKRLKTYLTAAIKNLWQQQAIAIFTLTLLGFIMLYGALLAYFPFLLSNNFEASSVTIGIMMTILSFSTAITASQLGRLSKLLTVKQLLIIGFLLYLIGMVLIPFMQRMWLLLVPILIYGAGQGINIPTIYSTVASLAPMDQRGVFMSINGTILRLGQTLGPLIMGWIYAFKGIYSIFFAGTSIALVGLIIIYIFINDRFT